MIDPKIKKCEGKNEYYYDDYYAPQNEGVRKHKGNLVVKTNGYPEFLYI